MKIALCSLAFATVMVAPPAAGVAAEVRSAASASTADRDWERFETALNGEDHAPRPKTVHERNARIFADIKRYVEAGDAFIRRHPDDPRRWKAFIMMQDFFNACMNILRENPGSTDAVDRVMSPKERTGWQQRFAELEKQFHAAKDVPAADRFQWDVRGWYETMTELRAAMLPPDSERWNSWRAGLDKLADKYSGVPETGGLVKHYNATRFPGNEDSPLWRQELRSLAESRNPHVADAARSQLQFLDLARAPIEIAFTAADGREVDLRQLRGKVVLVDFWATWCAPCIAELPTVKKVYSAYRDKGFEIVGISLENPGIRPNDSAEQRKAKLEKARMALLEFAQRENLPWPQYFDGKWWKNEIAQRYAVQSIPAMFLLDKNGMLVTTDARGPRLEAEVKRLLAE